MNELERIAYIKCKPRSCLLLFFGLLVQNIYIGFGVLQMFGTFDKLILEQSILLGQSFVLKLLLIFQIVEARQILLHLGLFDERFLQMLFFLLQILLEFCLEFFLLLAFHGLHARLFRLYLTLHFFIELTHVLIVSARFARKINCFFLIYEIVWVTNVAPTFARPTRAC